MNERLRELRRKRNLSQTYVAAAIGVTQPTMSGYETGYSTPDIQTISKLAEVLGTTTDYLVGITDNPEPVVTKIDPQILKIMHYCRGMSAQGIEKVVEYADILAHSGKYQNQCKREK